LAASVKPRMPEPTGCGASVNADHLQGGSDEHVAAAVYAATLLAMSIAFFGTNLLAGHRRRFADFGLGRHRGYVIAQRRRTRGLRGGGRVAFVSATASLALCGLVAVSYLLPGRPLRDETGAWAPGDAGIIEP